MNWDPYRAAKFGYAKAKSIAWADDEYIGRKGQKILLYFLDSRISFPRKMEIIYLFDDVFDFFIRKDLFCCKSHFIVDVQRLFSISLPEAERWSREAMLSAFI